MSNPEFEQFEQFAARVRMLPSDSWRAGDARACDIDGQYDNGSDYGYVGYEVRSESDDSFYFWVTVELVTLKPVLVSLILNDATGAEGDETKTEDDARILDLYCRLQTTFKPPPLDREEGLDSVRLPASDERA